MTADVAIDGGKVQAVGPELAADRAPRSRCQPAAGSCLACSTSTRTTMPKIEAMPGLEESVRHGVTTVVMGNCSLSAAMGKKKDILDLFCRVESLPRDVLSKWLGERTSPWNGVREYYEHLETLPMGPNVASLIGHSNVRAARDGHGAQPDSVSKAEPRRSSTRCSSIVDDAMAEGYLGLSIDMLPWHRLDGEPFRGISVPSQHAHPSEYRSLAARRCASAIACCRPRPTR